MVDSDFQENHSRIEKFVSDVDQAYDAIALLRANATDMPDEILRSYLAALAREYGVSVVFELPKALQVVRAIRLHDKAWPQLENHLGYPPPAKTRLGRCNLPAQPLLYTALYEDTALAEIGATRGDHCVISTFEFPAKFRFVTIGQFDLYRRTGEVNSDAKTSTTLGIYEQIMALPTAELSALFDAFLADEFLRPSKGTADYKISSIFSDVLLKDDLKPSKPIDAIMYPSVEFRHGLNIAVRSDSYESQVKLVKAKVVEIKEALGFGLFRYRKLASFKGVPIDKKIVWHAEPKV